MHDEDPFITAEDVTVSASNTSNTKEKFMYPEEYGNIIFRPDEYVVVLIDLDKKQAIELAYINIGTEPTENEVVKFTIETKDSPTGEWLQIPEVIHFMSNLILVFILSLIQLFQNIFINWLIYF